VASANFATLRSIVIECRQWTDCNGRSRGRAP
jgi:hypothetical protein